MKKRSLILVRIELQGSKEYCVFERVIEDELIYAPEGTYIAIVPDWSLEKVSIFCIRIGFDTVEAYIEVEVELRNREEFEAYKADLLEYGWMESI